MNINNWKSSPNWDSLLFEDMSGFSDYDYTPVYSVDATLAPPPPKTKSGTIARPTATGGKTQTPTADASKLVSTGVVKQPTNPKTISSQLQADKPASITIKQKVVAPVFASGGGGGGGGVSEPDKPEETTKPTEEKKGMNVKALAVVAAIGVGVIYYFNK